MRVVVGSTRHIFYIWKILLLLFVLGDVAHIRAEIQSGFATIPTTAYFGPWKPFNHTNCTVQPVKLNSNTQCSIEHIDTSANACTAVVLDWREPSWQELCFNLYGGVLAVQTATSDSKTPVSVIIVSFVSIPGCVGSPFRSGDPFQSDAYKRLTFTPPPLDTVLVYKKDWDSFQNTSHPVTVNIIQREGGPWNAAFFNWIYTSIAVILTIGNVASFLAGIYYAWVAYKGRTWSKDWRSLIFVLAFLSTLCSSRFFL